MTIKEQIHHLEKSVDKRLNNMQAQLLEFTKEIRGEMTPLRDFMITQQAVKNLEAGKDVSVSPAVLNIIKWCLLIIGALVGIKLI